MRTGIGLVFICLGAILAFAVKGSPSFLNLHIAGWVIMVIGAIGLTLPRRSYGWLGRRMLVRRTYPEGTYQGGRVEQIPVPPYVTQNPGTSRIIAGLPPQSSLLDDPISDPIDNGGRPRYRPAQNGGGVGDGTGRTEVIEDLYEQP